MVFLKNCRIFFAALGENLRKAGGTYALQRTNTAAFAFCSSYRPGIRPRLGGQRPFADGDVSGDGYGGEFAP